MFNKITSTFVYKIITALVSLGTAVLISQLMGAESKGQTSLIVFWITMILLVSNIAGGSSLVYLVPRHNLFQLVVISNLWSALVCLPAWAAFSLFDLVPRQFIPHIIFLSLINSFTSTNLTVLVAKQKIRANNIISMLLVLIGFIVLFFLLKRTGERTIQQFIYSLYAAQITCLFISTIPLIKDLLNIQFSGSMGIIRELFRTGMTNQAGHIMKFMSVRLSYYFISYVNGDAELGVFSNGVSLIESLLLITNSFALVQYSSIANTEDKAYSRQLTLRLTRISTFLSLLGALVMVLLPAGFYTWLFGNEFSGVKEVIVILAPGIVLYNIGLITGHYFSGIGKYHVNSWGNFAGLLLSVILTFACFNTFSIQIAGLISTLTYFVTTAIVFIWFLKETGFSIRQFIPTLSDINWIRENYFTKG